MKATTPEAVLQEVTKGLRFTKNFDPVANSDQLDAIQKLVLAEVLHYRVGGLQFHMSMDSLSTRAGTSRSTLKKRMRDLEKRRFIEVTVSRRNFNQANVVEVGPATLALLQRSGVVESRNEHMASTTDDPFQEPPFTAVKPQRQPPAEKAAPRTATPKRAARPTWQVNKVVSSADEKLPVELFKMLNYNPSKGRELTEADAVKVFAWHGVANERAWEWWDAWLKADWPPEIDGLERCRKAAAKRADEQVSAPAQEKPPEPEEDDLPF